jgi:hypothetical protein
MDRVFEAARNPLVPNMVMNARRLRVDRPASPCHRHDDRARVSGEPAIAAAPPDGGADVCLGGRRQPADILPAVREARPHATVARPFDRGADGHAIDEGAAAPS